MNFSDYRAMLFRRDGHVLHATFNRPDTLNAVDADLEHDLGLFGHETDDGAVRADRGASADESLGDHAVEGRAKDAVVDLEALRQEGRLEALHLGRL